MKKRVLAGFLTLCLLAGILAAPVNVSTADAKETEELEQEQAIKTDAGDPFSIDGFEGYTDGIGFLYISKYTGPGGDVVVPARLGGITVMEVKKNTFSGRTDIESVTFEEGIQTIEEDVFENCPNIKNVVINLSPAADSFFVLGNKYHRMLGVFDDCKKLESINVIGDNGLFSSSDGVLFNATMKDLIVYPAGKKDSSYQIPHGVKNISMLAFSNNPYLKTLKVSEDVTELTDFMSDCSALQRLELPSSLSRLQLSCIECENLSQVVFPSGNVNYQVTDGVVYKTEGKKVAFVPGGKTGRWVLPEGIKEIPSGCMDYNNKITSVLISDEITNIEEYALSELSGIKEFQVEEQNTCYEAEDGILYTKTGELVCYPSQKAGAHFTVPSTVKKIWVEAFTCPRYLKTVTISENTTEFADYDPETGLIPNDIYWPYDNTMENIVCFMVKEGSMAEEYMQAAHYRYCTGHAFSQTSYTAPTCTKAGAKIYTCGKSTCKYAYTETVAPLNHTNQTTFVKATTKADGKIVTACSRCKTQLRSETIAKIKTIKLSDTKYTYNKKVKTPKVTIKDRTGKTLKEGTDYTLSYDKGRKKIGKYTVKITFKGNYSGTVKKTFSIVPKGTALKDLIPKEKAVVLKWKKQTSKTSGYQVRLSTNKKFTKKTTKTVTINQNKTTKKTVEKLKTNKKYYVQIRTYKTVKIDNKNTKLYSDWSKTKTVKVK